MFRVLVEHVPAFPRMFPAVSCAASRKGLRNPAGRLCMKRQTMSHDDSCNNICATAREAAESFRKLHPA
eukprot:15442110-Alexandrium_andersonii.AAC.1